MLSKNRVLQRNFEPERMEVIRKWNTDQDNLQNLYYFYVIFKA
jgi:hypothetical protein